MFDFTDRIVLVGGASGNLGQAVARAFHAAGANLVLLDRKPGRLAALFPELAASPDHLLLDSVDAADAASVDAAVQAAVERFGRLDIVANTVGGYRAGTPVHETPPETWEFMLTLNARTAFVLSRAAVPHMLERGAGKIVHVAARASLQGTARAAAYSASKSAILRLVESLSAELKHTGINVNCVLPGTIDTPANRKAMPDADFSKWTAPAAIAEVFVFLASESGAAVNGAEIPV